MPDLSRRKFLTHASVGVAAGMVAGGAVAGGVAAIPEVAGRARKTKGAAASEPLVAHVRDASTGEISVMVGTEEVVYQDHDLVDRLMQSAPQRSQR